MSRLCNEIQPLIAAYQDRELTAEEQSAVEAHLQQCATCMAEVQANETLRQGLRVLARQQERVRPPAHLWKNAVHAWNRRDSWARHRVQLRLALVGACILLMAMSLVLASRTNTVAFPIEEALHDYTQFLQSPGKPEYATQNSTHASRHLRQRLKAEVRAIPLYNTGATLERADVLETANLRMGRLIYRYRAADQSSRTFAIYIAPKGANFPGLSKTSFDNRPFFMKPDKNFMGWTSQGYGYALVASETSDQINAFAREAQIESESSTP